MRNAFKQHARGITYARHFNVQIVRVRIFEAQPYQGQCERWGLFSGVHEGHDRRHLVASFINHHALCTRDNLQYKVLWDAEHCETFSTPGTVPPIPLYGYVIGHDGYHEINGTRQRQRRQDEICNLLEGRKHLYCSVGYLPGIRRRYCTIVQ